MRFPLRRILACAALAVIALARPAGAVELRETSIAVSGEWTVASLRAEDAFSERISQTVDRGMPVTVVVTVDIWQDRSGWFDRLVGEQQVISAEHAIRYATYPNELKLHLSGINDASNRAWASVEMGALSRNVGGEPQTTQGGGVPAWMDRTGTT